MTFGLPIELLIAGHVAISLIAIFAGFIALTTLVKGRWNTPWQVIFIVMTFATSATGFLFPFKGFTPALGTGIVSLFALTVALTALFVFGRDGIPGKVYAVAASTAQWLNLFVLVVQAFLKVPLLNALAPTGTEPAFFAAQALVLGGMAFLVWTIIRGAGVRVRKAKAAA